MSLFYLLDEINITANKKLIESIKFCWSDQVYLYLLTHKYWKLTMQVGIKNHNNKFVK